MARARHRRTNSSSNARTTHQQKLRELSKRGVQVDPTNARSVAQKYRQLRDPKSFKYRNYQRIPKHLERPAPKRIRDELKQHGFRTTARGVVVDGPRDKRRNPLKGSRVQVMKGGVVKTSVGQRRDFIYGFTKKEKKEFARDPARMEKEILARLRRMFPSLRKAKPSKIQRRLQWGAYQATKDFSPNYFTAKYFTTVSPEEIRKVGKKRATPRVDKLTGFHFVVHIPKASKARKRKGSNAKKSKGRR